jgi:DnaJ-class molecular chaperone
MVPDNIPRTETSVTHLGVTYLVTESAHYGQTPLETCPYCQGSGELDTRKCRNCKGRGLIGGDKPAAVGR